MTWKQSLGAIALMTAVVCSLAGCGETAVSTATQSTDITTSVASSVGDGTATTVLLPPSQGERPSPPTLDYAAAATKLGVTEQRLRDALLSNNQSPPDFSAAAATLGVTEEFLREALGFQLGNQPIGSPPGGNQRAGIPPTVTPESN
jgi:hypothetical protein